MPFLRTPALKIHYEQGGTGDRSIILLHGNFASWRWWLPVLNQVPLGYRVYAPDLRGCGDTEKPGDGYSIHQLAHDLSAFVDALSLDHVHLAGHSLGGAVAMQFALDRFQCVKSLILVAPAPAEGMSVRHSSILGRGLSEDTMARLLPDIVLHRPVLMRSFKRIAPHLTGKAQRQVLVEDALRISPLAVTGFVRSLNRWNIQAELGKLQMPVLILGGSLDPLVPEAALRRTAVALSQACLVIWADAGHVPQLEHPERFRILLREFLDKPMEIISSTVKPKKMVPKERKFDRLRRILGRLLAVKK
jgi:3-oxoadipate enol-lactonase